MIPVTKHVASKIVKSQTTFNKQFTTSRPSSADIPTTHTCGIPKWDHEKHLAKIKEEEKAAKMTLPAHLIRPPCLPGGTRGGFQTCITEVEGGGMYCTPLRLKYKYCSFSENINFIPPREDDNCWWKMGIQCIAEDSEEIMNSITKPIHVDHQMSAN